jgi:hypothetical protein
MAASLMPYSVSRVVGGGEEVGPCMVTSLSDFIVWSECDS